MVERQKPITPSADDLWLESKSGHITLVDRNEMLRRFREIMRPRDPADLENRFFPLLLQYAGQTMPISRVPALVVEAIREYVKDNTNLRNFAAQNASVIMDVMMDDPSARSRAREFLASAING